MSPSRRRFRVFALLAVIGCMSLGCSGAALAQVTPTPSLTAGGLILGISYGGRLSSMSTTALDRSLDDAVALGVTWVRDDLRWSDVQPERDGPYRWTAFDRVVRAATARGLQVLPILDSTPRWAREPGCLVSACPPAGAAPFADFAHAAAAHYSALGVDAFEIWNEPNLTTTWAPTPQPRVFATYLRMAADAIHRAEPGAVVVSGGLAPVGSSMRGMDPRQFLKEVCAGGGLKGVDAVGVHPYSYPVPPDYYAPWSGWSQMDQTPVSIRSTLRDCGEGSLPLWITEYGAPTGGLGAAATPQNYNLRLHPDHVSLALQAEMASQAIQLAGESPSTGALFYYTDRDSTAPPGSNRGSFGLATQDGVKKPAWYALRSAIATYRNGG